MHKNSDDNQKKDRKHEQKVFLDLHQQPTFNKASLYIAEKQTSIISVRYNSILPV